MRLHSHLDSYFKGQVRLQPGDHVLIAFSGGPDSTALLGAMKYLAPDLGVQVHAVHVDHALDDDSTRRAEAARHICKRLAVPLRSIRRRVAGAMRPGESPEAAARRIRYECLEQERLGLCARYVMTAHHADDQIETILLRTAYGSGIEGLAGIQTHRGAVLRPLLGLSRLDLRQSLETLPLHPVEDPTNLDLRVPRNRLRHLTWPSLLQENPGLDRQLLGLAAAAARARKGLESRLRTELELRSSERGPEIDCQQLLRLPQELWPYALSMLHRAAGAPYPASSAARQELTRQLHQGGAVGCDCGDGWRWELRGRLLGLYRRTPPAPSFAYTVKAPGECDVPEVALRFRIRQGAVDDWMFQPSEWRAGLLLPLVAGQGVVVRSRRDGDRIRPFGCGYSRRLKDVLIDRRVPRQQRSRLALLEVDSRLAWVPGVTIDDRYRVEVGGRAWIAELESL